jgi:hypothetical protein
MIGLPKKSLAVDEPAPVSVYNEGALPPKPDIGRCGDTSARCRK